MFCPKCGSEYRAEFKLCQECGADLVPQLVQSSQSDVEYIGYEELLTTSSPSEVAIMKSLLDAEGIIYLFQGETTAPYLYFAVPIRLLVKKDQLTSAAEILKDLQLSTTYSYKYKEEKYEDTGPTTNHFTGALPRPVNSSLGRAAYATSRGISLGGIS